MFRKIITKTIHWLLGHKETRRILEEIGTELLENEKTRPVCEKIFLKAVLRYGERTKL